ncbi:MAG TPA: hypothetical protein VNZ50_18150 [Hyphomicrobiaceae bacterium]|nr:hypothetical protein [Hyphomicrobiaceae bacterium]
MRTPATVLGLFALTFLVLPGAPAAAAPLPSHRVAITSGVVLTNGHRPYHHRVYRHRAKHSYRHRKCHKGWLPPLPRYRHAPGKWSHKHCHDWHRCHYYFYGYKQWARWNPEKSRAYFYRRYHH